MIADVLGSLVADWRELTGANAELAVVPNRFFGSRVRVSGLLTGQDIIANAPRYRGDILILPSVMLDKTGTRLLDGYTPAELASQLNRPVYFAGYLAEVHRIVFDPAVRVLSA
jgi:NifB/MoaA-like Fe-S oxidoreductase